MDPGGGRAEAERSLEIAARLLAARDLVGSKRFAERALESDPLLDGVDQVLAVADVLLAAPSSDPLAILQIPPSSHSPLDPSVLARSYRRLALLLRPDRNPHPGADAARRLVADAFSTLSKSPPPPSKSKPPAPPSSVPPPSPPVADSSSFWTGCPSCCHLHEYPRKYLDVSLRCPSCRHTFIATELPNQPPILPGTDMYFCSWGFSPVGGFPSGQPEAEWNPQPFVPAHPSAAAAAKQEEGSGPLSAAAKRNKKVAKKKVGGPPPVGSRPGAAININEAASAPTEGKRASGDVPEFHIDLDSTEEILSNLHNLPFLS